jgi:hypothetical protein
MIKNIWELFLFKYIIPKYLRRIWVNKIRFEKAQVAFQRECGSQFPQQLRLLGRFPGEPE